MRKINKLAATSLIMGGVSLLANQLVVFASPVIDNVIDLKDQPVIIASQGQGTMLYGDRDIVGVFEETTDLAIVLEGVETYEDGSYNLSGYKILTTDALYLGGVLDSVEGTRSQDILRMGDTINDDNNTQFIGFETIHPINGATISQKNISGSSSIIPASYTLGNQVLTEGDYSASITDRFTVVKESGNEYKWEIDFTGKLAYSEKTTLNITVGDKIYNGKPHTIAFTLSHEGTTIHNGIVSYKFAPVTYVDGLVAQPSLESFTNGTPPVMAGEYWVIANYSGDPSLGYHNTNSQMARFKINTTPLTITPVDMELKSGELILDAQVRYNGFVNGEDYTVLKNQLETTVIPNSNPTGEAMLYATEDGKIYVSGQSADNYSISYGIADLVVTEKDYYTITGNMVEQWYTEDIIITPTDSEYKYVKTSTEENYRESLTLTESGQVELMFAKKSGEDYIPLAPITLTYSIDKTIPTIEEVVIGEIIDNTIVVTVNAVDEGSGISQYSFDGGINWQEGNTFTYSDNQEIALDTIQIKDNAGNIGKYNQLITIDTLDKTPPVISGITLNHNTPENTVTVVVNATDPQGEVVSYSYDGGVNWVEDNTFTYSQNQTIATETIKVKDPWGNTASYLQETVINQIDNSLPVIEAVATSYNSEDNTVTITITATDDNTNLSYSYDGGESWSTTNSKVYIDNTLIPIDAIQVKDIVDNTTKYQPTVEIKGIDKTPPVMTTTIASGSVISTDGQVITLNFNEVVKATEGINLVSLDDDTAITWTISEDGKAVSFNSLAIEEGELTTTIYKISGITDIYGNVMEDISLSYKTIEGSENALSITTLPTTAVNLPTMILQTGSVDHLVSNPITAADKLIADNYLRDNNILSANSIVNYYDLQLVSDGGNISRTIYLPFPAGFSVNSGYDYKVYHFPEGEVIPKIINGAVTSTGIMITTSEFSPFVLVATLKNTAVTPSVGGSNNDNDNEHREQEYWDELKLQVEEAEDGEFISTSLRGYTQVPASLLRLMFNRDITLELNWSPDNEMTINGLMMFDIPATKVYYNIDDLYDIYKDGGKTPEPTVAPTATPTPSPTVAPTATPTPKPTATPTPTATATPTPTPTATTTATPEPTVVPTPEPTPSQAPVEEADTQPSSVSGVIAVLVVVGLLGIVMAIYYRKKKVDKY